MCYPREFRDINERLEDALELQKKSPFYTMYFDARFVFITSFNLTTFLILMTYVFCSFTDSNYYEHAPLRTILQSLPYARLRDALATHPRTLRRPLTQESS
ncbi:hypothetical protein Avbf_16387 [Armadillidium vulgare]|nr:hypothetical protein Avbf_16387 [Armadillidium vulgare]